MIASQLARNIQFLRKREQLSQQALAEKLQLTRSNIASYENGKAEPRATKLLNIAKYFRVNLSQLIETNLRELSPEELEKTRTHDRRSVVSLSPNQEETIDEFLRRSADLNKILDGFKEFYKFKVQNLKTSSGMHSIIHDFENLLSVMDSLQKFNQELVDFVHKTTGRS